MKLIVAGEDGNQRSRVDQNLHRVSPNPLKYFGLVLKSRGPDFTQPITPALTARSYAEGPSGAFER